MNYIGDNKKRIMLLAAPYLFIIIIPGVFYSIKRILTAAHIPDIISIRRISTKMVVFTCVLPLIVFLFFAYIDITRNAI